MDDRVKAAAHAIRTADALLITTGAGMGVDSGLPDFRGDHGFWHAYPPYAALGLSFSDLADPRWFRTDPALAWGFYGHRLELYRRTLPHDGFAILRAWEATAPSGAFVFTSNVDGQFQRAGFDPQRIVECHGSIHLAQCTRCERPAFAADDIALAIDMATMRAPLPLPTCDRCGALLRPAILMFGDGHWEDSIANAQHRRLQQWLVGLPDDARLVVVECGAGTAIPTVRYTGERLQSMRKATLVRINPRESNGPRGTISIAMGARDALRAIAAATR